MRLITLLGCFYLSACDRAGPLIETHRVPAFVSPHFDTELDAHQAKLKILSKIQSLVLRGDEFYQRHGFKSDGGFSAEFTAEANSPFALYGREFFRDQAHANDIYLHTQATVMSSYYQAAGKPLHYHAEFAVSLQPLSNSGTRVSIRSRKPAVYNGTEFNAHVGGYIPMRVAVEASPLEEYRMLVHIAHALGTELPTLQP